MLGLSFEHCNSFGLDLMFNQCNLSHVSFYRTKLQKTTFSDCKLHEAMFTECDLKECIFDDCDLDRAVFQRADLEKTDFRTAYNYAIDPEANQMKNARFALPGITGLLQKYDIIIE